MTKLKTLKDLEGKYHPAYDNLTKEIRSEAVKWVKELKDAIHQGSFFCLECRKVFTDGCIDHRSLGDDLMNEDGLDERLVALDWIKCFFNIKDEDLE